MKTYKVINKAHPSFPHEIGKVFWKELDNL